MTRRSPCRLVEAKALQLCLDTLRALLPAWASAAQPVAAPTTRRTGVWARDLNGDPASEHMSEGVFDDYSVNLTEAVLRLPQQVPLPFLLSLGDLDEEDQPRSGVLRGVGASSLRASLHPKRLQLDSSTSRPPSSHRPCQWRQGEREWKEDAGIQSEYKLIRDRHALLSALDQLDKNFFPLSSFSHQQLTEMLSLVSFVNTTAAARPTVWQRVCEKKVCLLHFETLQLNWLLQFALKVPAAVSGGVVEMIQGGLRVQGEGEDDDVGCRVADALLGDDTNRALLK